MPTIAVIEGYRFFFFSNEGNEPPHVHVEKADGYGKLWLEPVALAYSTGVRTSPTPPRAGDHRRERDIVSGEVA